MESGTRLSSLIPQLLLLAGCFALINADITDKCKYCNLMVETFKMGIKRTENQHFAGGNTDWEERKLGKFAKSETRLVEILEYLCKLSNLDNTKNYTGVKDIEFKCQELAEEHEENLENWFFHKQNSDPDMLRWLCFDKLKLCCTSGHFGPDCKPCPGVHQNLLPCSGHGKCHGDGSREGTGKCKCDRGYLGLMCSNCDANHYAVNEDTNNLECKECHKACRGGCLSEGPKGCKECRSGWVFDKESGCIDIDECAEETKCKGEHEVCVNTEGSFSCECQEGYERDHSLNVCKLDVNGTVNAAVKQSSLDAGAEVENLTFSEFPESVSGSSVSTADDQKSEL